MEAADDFLCFVGGGRLCRSTFDVGISSKLTSLLSVSGTSMWGNHNTKVCRHTRNHVAKIGLLGRKLATFCLVANMLPTCCRHVADITSQAVLSWLRGGQYHCPPSPLPRCSMSTRMTTDASGQIVDRLSLHHPTGIFPMHVGCGAEVDNCFCVITTSPALGGNRNRGPMDTTPTTN